MNLIINRPLIEQYQYNIILILGVQHNDLIMMSSLHPWPYRVKFFLMMARTFKIYSPQLSNIQYGIINYSQHAVHCILNDLCIL